MAMHKFASVPVVRTTSDASSDLAPASGSTRGGWMAEEEHGVSLLASGSQPAGALVCVVSTTGLSSVRVSWKCRTILQQDSRDNSIALQFRSGVAGGFTDAGSATTYASTGTVAGDSSLVFSETLPNAATDQSVLCIRWMYWESGGTSGSRDRVAIDDITIEGDSPYDPPVKLEFVHVNFHVPPSAMTPFDVQVSSVGNLGAARSVESETEVELTTVDGAGSLGGNPVAVIAAGETSATWTDLTYDAPDSGVKFTARVRSGDTLESDTTGSIAVLERANHLVFIDPPENGTTGLTLDTFSVAAVRPDSSIDLNFSGDISLSLLSGTGSMTGTATRTAVAGIARFEDISFEGSGSYTLTAISGGLVSTAPTNVEIFAVPSRGEILINQFSPDYGLSSDEYVELVNTTEKLFDASLLKIEYHSAGGNPGAAGGNLYGIIRPHSYWLLSGRDTVTVGLTSSVVPECSLSTGFSSTAGQLALKRRADNFVIDGLAYGTVTSNTLGENSPAAQPPSNGGLKRAIDGVDTDNNAADFVTVSNSEIFLRNSSSPLLPVELVQFRATFLIPRQVLLEWTTISETNNFGFYVERKDRASDQFLVRSQMIEGNGTTLDIHHYSWTDENPEVGLNAYRLRQIDSNGDLSYSHEVQVEVDDQTLAVHPEAEEKFSFFQSHDPLNGRVSFEATIAFRSFISVRIFDILGKEVEILCEGWKEKGTIGVAWQADGISSGIYLARMFAVDSEGRRLFQAIRKVPLLK